MTNVQLIHKIVSLALELEPLAEQYDYGKIALADGTEIDLSQDQINALKAIGAAKRAAIIAAAEQLSAS